MAQQKTHKQTVLRLRRLRRDREMTQGALAKLVGLNKATISALEHGKTQPSLKTARAIANVFGEPVESVFAYVEVPA